MMASAECCFSVTIDGRTERVPFLGDGDADRAPFSTDVGDTAYAGPRQVDRLESLNTLANRPFDAWFGHRLFFHRSNLRVGCRWLHRWRYERYNRPVRPDVHLPWRDLPLAVFVAFLLPSSAEADAHGSSLS